MLGMRNGTRVRVTRDIHYDDVQVRAGELGTVTARNLNGEVWITLDTPHRGLEDYHNAIWITPGFTGEYASAFKRLCLWHTLAARLTSRRAGVVAAGVFFAVFIINLINTHLGYTAYSHETQLDIYTALAGATGLRLLAFIA